MNILPIPKKVEINECFLANKSIRLESDIEDCRIINALNGFQSSESGTPLNIIIGNEAESEKYSLKIEPNKIVINADGNRGAFYALQTLKQIFGAEKVQCCYIEDEPDFKYRGFYHDITRGRVPNVSAIKKLIDNMAYYKLNSLQLYVEHTFDFKEFADSVERSGCLTAEEIRELDEYCKMNFIEFVPSLSTFGHLFELLNKEEYKHLREIEDFDYRIFWHERMAHHTIDPTKDESFELIKSLIDQYIVNFSSDKFNICCDETYDLKIGRHKDEDTGKLYIDFVNKIIGYVKSKGKTVQMWADILLNYPEQIEKLPEDVQILNWYYWDKPDENTFKTIQQSGCTQLVCPGTGSWSRFCENYEMDIINITKMVDLAGKYGAEGILNTNWGDWGNPCSIDLAMFGCVLGAAKSWNASTVVDRSYLEKVNSLLYKKEGANEYIKRLSDLCEKMSWLNFVKHYVNLINGKELFDEVVYPTEEETKEVIDGSLALIDELSSQEWKDSNYKEQILISAEATAVIAEIFALTLGYAVNRKTDTQKWLGLYREKWLSESKESELREIEKVFCEMEKIIGKDA